ncbi:succinate dehydrogenase, hydrophobic membrane anchor protein [Nitrosococcus oceani]|uniref:Succinate dehydrogenase hydrophobic membrane anchor subunit n=3 Tax=Nitrosococcus oceani TaxID=1229 RepID=Q3J8C1_NITOC|nr:succinate dehydrogenase, hydrophobic membrane anchor protein [Nitrosococcus oceani]ABA58925.1 succinate dehydrogenase subunit D [Nitrosococcus oceani ATCC 19707]KFI18725.1 succinate dehydrogenase [Nitrosococcus oceani C-27]KFI21843.1 succinate dehydrogenase [Nitrosococcus oceani]GEM18979.1 succinate dehydrogenase, hydrophobic membrane anchor protein [Nitrosococcus oceani]
MTGLRAWLVQRGTAVIMLVLLLFFLARLMQGSFKTYEAWREWISDPLVSIMVALFFGVLLLHSWVGLRDIILDYVRPVSLRLFAHSLIVVVYSGIGFWVIRILLR